MPARQSKDAKTRDSKVPIDQSIPVRPKASNVDSQAKNRDSANNGRTCTGLGSGDQPHGMKDDGRAQRDRANAIKSPRSGKTDGDSLPRGGSTLDIHTPHHDESSGKQGGPKSTSTPNNLKAKMKSSFKGESLASSSSSKLSSKGSPKKSLDTESTDGSKASPKSSSTQSSNRPSPITSTGSEVPPESPCLSPRNPVVNPAPVLRANFVIPMDKYIPTFYPAINTFDLMQRLGESDWRTIAQFVRKLRVTTEYLKNDDQTPKIKHLKIRGLGHMRQPILTENGSHKEEKGILQWARKTDPEPGDADQLEFYHKKDLVSVNDYFAKVHKIQLKHPKFLVLDCGGNKKSNWIPAELATVMPGQSFRGKLNENQRSMLIEMGHSQNGVDALKNRTSQEDEKDKKILKAIELLPKTVQRGRFDVSHICGTVLVPGRLLQAPKLQYGDKRIKTDETKHTDKPEIAAWNMEDNSVIISAQSQSKWTIMKFGEADVSSNQVSNLTKAFDRYGLNVAKHELIVKVPLQDSSERKLEERFANLGRSGVRVILAVLEKGGAGAKAHDIVKRSGDRQGLFTICVQSSKLEKLLLTGEEEKSLYAFAKGEERYYANVALKFNALVGGINHVLHQEVLLPSRKQDIMFVGIDMAAAKTRETSAKPGVAAVVANGDDEFGHWPGSISQHRSHEEWVMNLEKMMKERFDHFKSKTQERKPSKIVVYIAGVSDSQYERVLEQEFKVICKARDSCCGQSSQVPITMIVVSQNHQNRVYSMDPPKPDSTSSINKDKKKDHKTSRDQASPSNTSQPSKEKPEEAKDFSEQPRPGSVIRTAIYTNGAWDFFLQAHGTTAGIAAPAHYIVIKDETKQTAESANEIEETTNNLCYLIGRSTAAVSVCAPAHYAGLLCKRAGLLLRPDGDGDKKGKKSWSFHLHKSFENTMFYI